MPLCLGVQSLGRFWLAPMTVKGDGDDLRRWLAERRDIFAAYVQMKSEV